jgi:CBS domain-containing protein
MDYLLKLSHSPPVAAIATSSVLDAVELMSANRVGAVGVVHDDKLVGIFTERDLMERVVLTRLDPSVTPLADVMTAPVESVRADGDPAYALERMVDRHIRHLPVTDESNHLLGMLSVRNLLQDRLEKARGEADSLEAFLLADGPGG